jgi:hypothetical protein
METLRHALGLCGEHWHPNIFNLSALTLGFAGVFSYIKYKFNILKSYVTWNKNKNRT